MPEPVEVGKNYVSTYIIRFPVWPNRGFLNKFIFPVLLKFSGPDGTLKITSAAFWSPDDLVRAEQSGQLDFEVPSDFKSGRAQPWAVLVTWHKTAESSGTLDQAGTEGWSRLIVAGTLVVLGVLTFRAFTTAQDVLTNPAKSPLFNPGFVIAAVVIVALFTMRRAP